MWLKQQNFYFLMVLENGSPNHGASMVGLWLELSSHLSLCPHMAGDERERERATARKTYIKG